ncbi:MAG: hypothetical protein CRN43_18305 [Candidatus Nephrothrix sp. EaCA]|nr:MAG: hypothetical protein CRN43_18305 [Candidatus Nephrothrix sp. EaCA]
MKEEKWNERFAMATAIGVHATVLLLFFLITAWRAPDPPIPEYGIELNFGMDEAGSGDEQPTVPIQQGEETAAEEEQKPAETPPPAEEPVETITSEEKSDVTLPEEKKEKKEEAPKTEVPKTETPKAEAPREVAKTEKETPKAAEAVNGKVKGKAGGAPSGGTQGQGDEGVLGDRGNPKGTIDGKALYGGGGGNGTTLNMAGWEWAATPKLPSLGESEGGRIVFEIECDEEGEIVGIKTLERGVSARAEQLLKDEIRKTSLMRTSGTHAPHRSKGIVLFTVKAK